MPLKVWQLELRAFVAAVFPEAKEVLNITWSREKQQSGWIINKLWRNSKTSLKVKSRSKFITKIQMMRRSEKIEDFKTKFANNDLERVTMRMNEYADIDFIRVKIATSELERVYGSNS